MIEYTWRFECNFCDRVDEVGDTYQHFPNEEALHPVIPSGWIMFDTGTLVCPDHDINIDDDD